MQALILAAGQGTRLGPIGELIPKPLLYLPSGSLLEYQLHLLEALSVDEVFIVVDHLAEKVEEHLRASGWENSVTLLRQRETPGLLGAILSAEDCIAGRFLVLHGDNYFSQVPSYFITAAEGAEYAFLTDGAASGLEAEELAASGCYLLSPAVFPLLREILARGKGDSLVELVHPLLARELPVEGVSLRGWRWNLNRPWDLLEVSARILEEWDRCFHPASADPGYNKAGEGFDLHPPCWLSPTSSVLNSALGPHVTVGEGAEVTDSILANAIVFPGAKIRDAHLNGAIAIRTQVYSLTRILGGPAQRSQGSLRGTPSTHFFLLESRADGPMPHTGDEERGYWGDTPHAPRPAYWL
jgi:NDP-sugar pyrophosphorylase family protein